MLGAIERLIRTLVGQTSKSLSIQTPHKRRSDGWALLRNKGHVKLVVKIVVGIRSASRCPLINELIELPTPHTRRKFPTGFITRPRLIIQTRATPAPPQPIITLLDNHEQFFIFFVVHE